jgi:hypothetical protein
MEEIIDLCINFILKAEGRDHLEDLGVDVRRILEWILKN